MRIGFLVLLAKLGGKAIPIFVKLLKGVKVTKLGLAAGSFGLWGLITSWQFAVVLMVALLIHESGHVWAMKKMGMKTKGFYFIPLLGAAAIPDSAFPSRGAEAFVAIMGPIWGGLTAAVPFMIWQVTDSPLWAGIASWIAMVNLFNLLPVLPLDGGRILRSIAFSLSSSAGFVVMGLGLAVAFYFSMKAGLLLFSWLFVIGGAELISEGVAGRKAKRLREKFERIQRIVPSFDACRFLDAKPDEAEFQKLTADIVKETDESGARKGFFEHRFGKKVVKAARSLGEDPITALERELFPGGTDENSVRERLTREIVFNFNRGDASSQCLFGQDEREQDGKIHIVSQLIAWFGKDLNAFRQQSARYMMFLRPMSSLSLGDAAFSYMAVAVLLYMAMVSMSHIPGAREALVIFMD